MSFAKLVKHLRPLASVARRKLLKVPRFTAGNVRAFGWDLDYVDGPSLWSSIDTLVIKKWNDFSADARSPVIIDCGANVGVSVLNYKRQYPEARITAFEPDPGISPVLKRNLRVNNAEDVEVVEAAVWVSNGEIPFICEGADGSKISTDVSATKRLSVRTIDFRDYVSGPIDLIKMDIEGAEFEVIPHLKEKLRLVKNTIIECHVDNKKISRFADILSSLELAGFDVSINSYGMWRDLVRKPTKLANEFDQYVLVAAWRTNSGAVTRGRN